MGKKIFIFLVVFWGFCSITVKAQFIILDFDTTPLNKVFIELRNKYQLRFSFDDNLLSQYNITTHKTLKNSENAVRYLLKDLPLDYEIVKNVFVIYPKKENGIPKKDKTSILSGYILDKSSGESLPYSHVIINGKPIVSDLSGFFSGKFNTDSIYKVKVSHLGYYLLDTVLKANEKQSLLLTPYSIKLHQVEITGFAVDFRSQIGQSPGVIKLNSKIAVHLPGFGDNSVFNLLRLQPGILASGEQTNDLIIWGCYAGQSKVQFDGFTVYSLKNFNDNISSFNPLMVKDIEVMKGGFDARYGERIGGIVNITGKTGNVNNVSFTFNVNNMTVNSIVEIPVKKRASFIVAFRHTYFNLYNPTNYAVHKKDTAGNVNTVDIHVVPNYVFRDINLKYSGKTKSKNPYYINLYSGSDVFVYNINQKVAFRRIIKQTEEKNTQFGGSFFYGKTSENGWSENFTVSASSLKENFFDHYQIEKLWNYTKDTLNWISSQNKITEFHARSDITSPLSQMHTLEWGGGILSNRSNMSIDTSEIIMSSLNMLGARLYSYLQDKINFGNHFSLRAGGRLNYAVNLKKYYIEPRLSAIIKLDENWKINLAFGIYNQFIAKTSVLDNQGNYRYLWAVCDNRDIPVLQAVHNVLSLSFFKNGFTFSAESYFKTTKGLSRYVTYKNIIVPNIYHGQNRSYGIDIMLKKEYKGHSAWIAYSLGKTEEHFNYFPDTKYRRAPQDQRHEIKLAVLVNLNPLFLSANYVYGSGFPLSYQQQHRVSPNYPYSRLDASISYKFINRKLKAEAGISILNILNTDNIKFANFERIPLNQTGTINIYAQAIPFTPTIYLNINL